jgi:hypothetical protein
MAPTTRRVWLGSVLPWSPRRMGQVVPVDNVLAEEDPGLGGQAHRRFAEEANVVVGRKVGRLLEVAVGLLDPEVGKLGQVLATTCLTRSSCACSGRLWLPGPSA